MNSTGESCAWHNYGKVCNTCHKLNHFTSNCQSAESKTWVRFIDDNDADEIFPAEVVALQLDDSNFITLKLKSRNFKIPGLSVTLYHWPFTSKQQRISTFTM